MQNNEYAALLDELTKLVGGQMRPLSPEERTRRGIDPRDPNQYVQTPSGHTIQTLIGWSDKPVDVGAITGQPMSKPGNWMAAPQVNTPKPGNNWAGAATPQIPKANANGLTRVSPGIYRDKSGSLVKRANG